MKKLVFLTCGIVEVSKALILYFNPHIMFYSDIPIVLLYKLYAISSFIIGLICLLVAKHYEDNKLTRHIFLCIMLLQASLTMMTYTADASELIKPLSLSIIHGILFIVLVFAYLSDIKKN